MLFAGFPRKTARRAALLIVLAPLAPAWADGPDARGQAVSVVPVRRHCFHERVLGTGLFAARRAADVRPDRDGLVVNEVVADLGDSVAADQVLARLVPAQGAPGDGAAIKAPISGTVIAVAAPIGSYVSASARDPMFRILGDDGLELKADVLASRLARVRAGMPVKVHVVGLGVVDGRVVSVSAAVDATTQAGVVSIAANDPRLRVGAFGRAEIDAGEDCGMRVPLSALVSDADGTVVGIVRDDVVAMRRVHVGVLEGGTVEVRDGLAENDLVIARATAFLREGDRVRAVPLGPERVGSQ